MKRTLMIVVMALAMAFVATGCCSWCNKSGKGCCKDSTTQCAKCAAKAADSKCAAKAADSKCAAPAVVAPAAKAPVVVAPAAPVAK